MKKPFFNVDKNYTQYKLILRNLSTSKKVFFGGGSKILFNKNY